jgi:hypothetical protein
MELVIWLNFQDTLVSQGLIQGTIPEFACRDWGKPENISVTIAGLRVEIWTCDLPNTVQGR